MAEQDNKERIIRLEEQMKAMKESLDDLTREVRDGFVGIQKTSASQEARWATKDELNSLKSAHQSLTQKLWVFVVFILLGVIGAVLANIGIK